MKFIYLFLFSFFSAFGGIWCVRELAFKNNWYVVPKSDRWHKKNTALHGGIGFIPIMICFQLFFVINFEINIPTIFWPLILGTISLFLLGWVDDIYPLSAGKKLFFQIIASGFFIHAGGSIDIFSNGLINIFISYFWFIVIINSLNMIDNMDGLAIGVSSISITFLVLTALISTDLNTNQLLITIAIIALASMIAFWLFNFNPASIFMGDSGSLSIGYILAALTIPSEINLSYGFASTSNDQSIIIFLIPLALLSVQIFDFGYVTLSRTFRGVRPYIGGKDHSSHCFVFLGLSDKSAVFVLYGICFLGGILSLLLKVYMYSVLYIFAGYFICLFILGINLALLSKKNTYRLS